MSTTRDLAHADHVGAGNLFQTAAQLPEIADSCVIHLDRPYRDRSGRSHTALTLRQLDELTDRIAAGFHHAGVRPKDPVGVFLPESVRYLLNYVALTKLGAIPVFVNSYLDTATAIQFLTRVGVVAVVSDPHLLPPTHITVPHHTTEPDAIGPFPKFTHVDSDPVLIAHTSGTTGVPKAVQFNHGGFGYGVKRQAHADLGRRILSALPQSHASAISVLMSAVIRGAQAMLVTDRDPERLAATVQDFRANLVAGFPKVFVDLCRLDLDQYDLSSVSRWMSTGDANHERHIRTLVRQGSHVDRDGQRRPGSLFIDNFGSSEFGFAMFRTVHTPTSERFGRCIGRPFDWVEAKVFGDDDQPVGPLVVGRLALKSPTVTAGYWNDSLRSEKNRVAGYWLTGDLAFLDEDGLCYHVDRTTDRIDTPRGVLYSAHVEELILKDFQEVFDCSLVGAPGPDGEVRAVLEVDLPDPDTDDDALLARVNAMLAGRQLPAIDQVVRKDGDRHVGVTGKALKRAMRLAHAAAPSQAGA